MVVGATKPALLGCVDLPNSLTMNSFVLHADFFCVLSRIYYISLIFNTMSRSLSVIKDCTSFADLSLSVASFTNLLSTCPRYLLPL